MFVRRVCRACGLCTFVSDHEQLTASCDRCDAPFFVFYTSAEKFPYLLTEADRAFLRIQRIRPD